ncbi:MAG TPA: hypothetical protein QGI30_07450, partial [Anaerolineales bacterium]|nr:hypothetical protein [Anaerolineales bacterium]
MASDVWVYVDQFQGNALPAAWETLGAAGEVAADLNTGVAALVFGHDVDELAQQAADYGADKV